MIERSAPGSAAAAVDPIVCPYLGLADDPRTHFAFPTAAHRCYSRSRPEPIETTHQARLCLSADYALCRRYVVPTAAPAPAVAPGGGAAPIARASRRRLAIRAAAILVGAVILAAVLLAVGGFLSAGPSRVTGPSPTASLATPTASPVPTASVAPTSEPTPTASTSPSPARSVRSLPTIHIVHRGETLTSIALHYGVTLAALEKANGIKDPSLIVVGQRLIIPAP